MTPLHGGRFRTSRGIYLLLAATLAATACGDGSGPPSSPSVVSPQPLPVDYPVAEFAPNDFSVDHTSSTTALSAMPETSNANETILAFAIDVPGASTRLTSAFDGSFTATFATPNASEFHVEGDVDGIANGLTDLQAASSGSLEPLAKPMCISTDASDPLIEQSESDESSTFSVTVTETCGAMQTITVALHDGTTFDLKDPPSTLGAHASVTVTVTHAATATAGDDVDLLIVSDSSGRHLVASLHAVTAQAQ
jgi:hypothetical protein